MKKKFVEVDGIIINIDIICFVNKIKPLKENGYEFTVDLMTGDSLCFNKNNEEQLISIRNRLINTLL